MRRKYGEQRTCTRCGLDVEWHGRANGWSDRGGNLTCPSYKKDGEFVKPKGLKHTVREP